MSESDRRNDAKMKAASTGLAVLLVIALVGGILSYKQVPEGNEGVTTEWGAVTGETLDSGAHWKIPVMQGVQDVEIRPRTYTMSNTAGEGQRDDADAITVKTVNGSSVDVDVTIRYRIEPENADQFVRDWNQESQMEQRLIRPTVRSKLRDEASDIQTSDIYTRQGREALRETGREALSAEFSDEPIELEAVQVRNINLPDSIDAALDKKEQAKQRVQIEQERVEQEKQRAKQRRVRAQAEADVIETRGEALQENPIVLKARMIEAYDNGTVFVTGDGGEQIILDGTDLNNQTVTNDGG
jgi:regulator of protease activity HflC (stomatin/prohibitin superfamily)